MKVAIIGTGLMAQHLGRGWSRVGHTIAFGSRTPAGKQWLAEQVKGASVVDQATAIESARTVVICLPYHATASFAQNHAEQLCHRLVIDSSNPFDLLPDNRLAGAEITANAIGPDARVVAAFKGNFAETLLEPIDRVTDLLRDVHYAGDNPDDKQIVALLIEDLGFRPVDCGPLKNARLLDGMVPLLLELDRRYGAGQRKSGWKFVSG